MSQDANTTVSFHISPSSGVPIFRQLMEQVQRLVACGRLHAGDLVPSVNALSRELAINPMTVSRAWNQLHDKGVLERVRGIGMRVAAGATLSLPERLAMLEQPAADLLKQASELSISVPELLAYLTELAGDDR